MSEDAHARRKAVVTASRELPAGIPSTSYASQEWPFQLNIALSGFSCITCATDESLADDELAGPVIFVDFGVFVALGVFVAFVESGPSHSTLGRVRGL